MFLDLDRFKVVNDTLGHSIGDTLLQRSPRACRPLLREEDTIARLGGDEFTILLVVHRDSATTPRRSRARSSKRRAADPRSKGRAVRHREHRHQRSSRATATTPRRCSERRQRDVRAKDAGRNSYQMYTPAMNAARWSGCRSRTICATRSTAASSSCTTSRRSHRRRHAIVGVEALLRWNHPERGLVGRRSSSRSPRRRG